ncbi:MAG: hypothetical protein ACE5D0_09715 [Fidelibacterota bacterium]
MRTFSFILGLSLLSTLIGQQQFPWSDLNYHEALQKSGDKIIMMDFYTEW